MQAALKQTIADYAYHYDHDNRLVQVKKNNDITLVADYTYDGLGRRIEKVDAIAAVTTRFYYDAQRVLLETEDSGSGFGDVRYYIWGNYIDELLVMRKLTETAADYYYAHDHLYSPVALFDTSGDVTERYEYDAYGKVRIMNANYVNLSYSLLGNTYFFTGRELDRLDAGNCTLMYYRARYYTPATGRFLQRDPYSVNPFDLIEENFYPISQYRDGMNVYSYGKSHPIGNKDPFGLVVTPAQCQAGINAAILSRKGTILLAALDKARKTSPDPQPFCATPRFFCRCCNFLGYFNPQTKNIHLCIGILNSVPEVQRVTIHELIHAWDDCKKHTNMSDCSEHACTEIRAYKESDMCDPGIRGRRPGEGKKDCVRRMAEDSVRANPNCVLTAAQDVAAVFDECWEDRVPFL